MLEKECTVTVSIVIPVYNTEKYLERCLDSVVYQQYSAFDVICINDASTDGSLNILKEYEKKNNNFTIVDSNNNRGLSASRNIGLRLSKADYIFFLDSDDYILPGAIERMVEAVGKSKSDLLLFSSDAIYENRESAFKQYEGRIKHSYELCEDGLTAAKQLIDNGDFKFSVWQHIYRRQFLLENQIWFEDDLVHEDLLFSYQVYFYAKKVSITTDILHKYYIHNDSLAYDIERNIKKRIYSFLFVYQKINEYYLGSEKSKNEDIFSTYCLMCIKSNVRLYYLNASSKQRVEICNCWNSCYEKYLFESLIAIIGDDSIDENELLKLKNKNVYIYGAGKYAQKLIPYIEKYNINVCGVIETKKTRETFLGYKVYGLNEISQELISKTVIIARNTKGQQEMIDEVNRVSKDIEVVNVFI